MRIGFHCAPGRSGESPHETCCAGAAVSLLRASNIEQRLEQEAQETVEGFRAPGYHVNGSVLRAVEATGHTYDSSVFSSAPYYFAKMGILGLMSLRGMNSKSILGEKRPNGAAKIRWNILMVIATLVATLGASWASYGKIG